MYDGAAMRRYVILSFFLMCSFFMARAHAMGVPASNSEQAVAILTQANRISSEVSPLRETNGVTQLDALDLVVAWQNDPKGSTLWLYNFDETTFFTEIAFKGSIVSIDSIDGELEVKICGRKKNQHYVFSIIRQAQNLSPSQECLIEDIGAYIQANCKLGRFPVIILEPKVFKKVENLPNPARDIMLNQVGVIRARSCTI
jgi:hypothetical protein